MEIPFEEIIRSILLPCILPQQTGFSLSMVASHAKGAAATACSNPHIFQTFRPLPTKNTAMVPGPE